MPYSLPNNLVILGISGPPKKYHLPRFGPLEVPKTSSKGIWRRYLVTPTPIDLVKWVGFGMKIHPTYIGAP